MLLSLEWVQISKWKAQGMYETQLTYLESSFISDEQEGGSTKLKGVCTWKGHVEDMTYLHLQILTSYEWEVTSLHSH